ncbi:MAG: ImmA/IrrE family metallo-endopeptidase [Isosphaeraceae bacterium]
MPEVTEVAEPVPFLSRSQIEARAGDVLRRHNLTTIPIDPVVLANREGIRVNNARFSDDNLVGMIVKRGGKITMLVKHDDPPFRKRFTIAHELGHHFLHLLADGEHVDKEPNLFRQQVDDHEKATSNRSMEIQANMFAASLLMPEEEVRRYWQERPSIEQLAKIFNVSNEAMGYRVASLDLE